MSNVIKFDHIKRLWYLQDGVIKTRHGNRPIKFKTSNKGYLTTDTASAGKKFTIAQHEAMTFRAEIEHSRRQELRALGLNCKRAGNRLTTATMRQINKRDHLSYRCRH
ncbi:TPA: hypothetical protein SI347_004710 [Escherichia coli]|nr:hypothetical protein [Escherichia coli]